MKVVLVDGSPAKQSHTSALLQYIGELFAEKDGVDTETITLKEWQLPYNDPELHERPWDHPHQGVRDFAQKISEADIVVLGTPLYHGTFSGLLKSAIDHLVDDAFKGKKVLCISNAAGIRVAQQGAQNLVVVPRTMGGQVYTRLIGTAKPDYADENGVYILSDQSIQQRCQDIVEEILALM